MKKMFPRDAAGSFTLTEGSGEITNMISCGDFLEIYKIDTTFRVQSPESIDPDRTNPNAPWTMAPVSEVGSSNRIVARLFIQSYEMLNVAIFERKLDKDDVTKHLHECKELLLDCEEVAKKLEVKIDNWIGEIQKSGVGTDNAGRAFNPFPVVERLETECSNFLTVANRVIRQICEIPYLFFDLEKKDSNFDHLVKRLEHALGGNDPLTEFVRENSAGVRYLAELRIYDEHPGPKTTVIKNFHVLPDGKIQVPIWWIEGDSDSIPGPIKETLLNSVDYLLDIAEAVTIHSIMGSISSNFPYVLQQISDKEINKATPIRYRLSIDPTKLNLPE